MSETKSKNRSFLNLAILAGILLLALLIGYATGHLDTVIRVFKATGLVMVAITILVTIHELGHFLTAKMFGMRVETFSIGFPPKILSFTNGETEYVFGATPLGGFVKISGIIDESMDTEHLNLAPQPYEFRAKPVWQRLIVMTGGVIMNVILGVFIFSLLKFNYGEEYVRMEDVPYGIFVQDSIKINDIENDTTIVQQTLGHFLGFRTGDKLLNFKGETFDNFGDYANRTILIDDDAYFEVERDGQVVRLDIPGNVQNYFDGKTYFPDMFIPRVKSTVKLPRKGEGDDAYNDTLPAYLAGLKDGDLIVALDSTPIQWFADVSAFTKTHPKGQPIQVSIDRQGQPMVISLTPNQDNKIGIERDFPISTRSFGFFEAFKPGSKAAFSLLGANFQGLKNLATRDEIDRSKSVMGPIQIANQYLIAFERRGLRAFWELTGMLSMILALVNILPIPALDGGHVVFLLIEGITRREPSTKVRIIAQQIGMVIILGLMVLIFGNDLFSLFR